MFLQSHRRSTKCLEPLRSLSWFIFSDSSTTRATEDVVRLFYELLQIHIEVDLVDCPFKVVETLQNSHIAKLHASSQISTGRIIWNPIAPMDTSAASHWSNHMQIHQHAHPNIHAHTCHTLVSYLRVYKTAGAKWRVWSRCLCCIGLQPAGPFSSMCGYLRFVRWGRGILLQSLLWLSEHCLYKSLWCPMRNFA